MKISGWAWVLAGAVALSVPAAASADDYGRRGDGWGRGGYGRDHGGDYDGNAYRRGLDRGYDEGSSDGARDARNGRGFNMRNDRTYLDADAGYSGRYGSRREYARAFRSGYERGYTEAFRANRRHGRDDRYRRDSRW